MVTSSPAVAVCSGKPSLLASHMSFQIWVWDFHEPQIIYQQSWGGGGNNTGMYYQKALGVNPALCGPRHVTHILQVLTYSSVNEYFQAGLFKGLQIAWEVSGPEGMLKYWSMTNNDILIIIGKRLQKHSLPYVSLKYRYCLVCVCLCSELPPTGLP